MCWLYIGYRWHGKPTIASCRLYYCSCSHPHQTPSDSPVSIAISVCRLRTRIHSSPLPSRSQVSRTLPPRRAPTASPQSATAAVCCGGCKGHCRRPPWRKKLPPPLPRIEDVSYRLLHLNLFTGSHFQGWCQCGKFWFLVSERWQPYRMSGVIHKP
jgi:hypothetical protein